MAMQSKSVIRFMHCYCTVRMLKTSVDEKSGLCLLDFLAFVCCFQSVCDLSCYCNKKTVVGECVIVFQICLGDT